jgi:hypothetical protein
MTKYKIFQMQRIEDENDPNFLKIRYQMFSDFPDNRENIDANEWNYKQVWESEMDMIVPESEVPYSVLNKLFEVFNTSHPQNYRGRSLSVSDIVQVEKEFYIVESIGFRRVNLIF